MKCVHCQTNVENALKGLDGVADVQVDLAAGSVTVEYDEALVLPAQMKEAVENAGRFELNL